MTQVLIVEDEAIVAESIASKLRRYGYEVVDTLPTGEEAVDKAGKTRPDVILMDIHLAGKMDGIQAADRISSQYHIPVIFLTAYADEQTIARAKEAGPFGYLVKPFRERDLYVTIEMARERSRLEAELEAANRELDSFSYSVSHDLRAPLIAIDGFSRILEETYAGYLPPDGVECLSRIRQAANQMDQLIEDFLRLSRVTRAPLLMEKLDISRIARDILGQLATHDPDRKVHWKVEEGLTVFGDPGLCEIALKNLIGNAWKYTMHTDNAQIQVGSLMQGQTRVFFIKDNGAGFPSEKANLLFIPLQRLHSHQEFPGNGIGLATVQRIVHRHGGRIWAEGATGEGATFFFTLPEEAG
ncbi:hybrid sensor histidine kinase/response regulator [Methanospirillum hungatei]|uniref:hybrid sensor histidine kinase/response regulator n=1 Tax=Methanospirillum hungatei TaxID=2203 RepID=UPI0026F018FB|nr:hybrid sensor histidine kinase/response regulator [Methanospirillum hungatei]MCA1914802.1 response regulator [Methanospirillum hungatei]